VARKHASQNQPADPAKAANRDSGCHVISFPVATIKVVRLSNLWSDGAYSGADNLCEFRAAEKAYNEFTLTP